MLPKCKEIVELIVNCGYTPAKKGSLELHKNNYYEYYTITKESNLLLNGKLINSIDYLHKQWYVELKLKDKTWKKEM